MRLNKIALTAAFVTVATGFAAGTSAAAPTPESVGFTARTTDTSSIIDTDAGSLVVEDEVFKIKAADGTVVAGMPLKLRIDEFEFPIAADISGRHATLTPQVDLAHASYQPVALPFEDKAPWKSEYEREQAAWSRMTSTISLGASIATLIGGLGGAAVGCVLGGLLGGVIVGGTVVGLFGPFVPAAVAGCLGGAAAMGAIGTIAGQIFITAPVAIGAVIQYVTTINQPFNPPAAK
ncbi:hypothetical protein [Nocardia sp. NPDC051832]|uniref:hypothetical protein n=1 Tax=Nocardia sp. NPDC051832 TaxID=3155673 RepID=UPI00341AB149